MTTLAAAATAPAQAPIRAEHETVRDALWFSTLYEEAVDSVYRYAYVLLRSAESAEDVTADVFLKAWRARHTLRNEQRSQPWLLAIARNSAMSLLRARRENVDINAIAEPADVDSAPSPDAFAEIDADRLQRALQRLTSEQQQVVFLRFFEGLSHEEVARKMNSNANAVRAIQFRALGRLRKLLLREFATAGA